MNWILLLFILVICFLVAELAFRIFFPGLHMTQINDPYFLYRNIGNQYIYATDQDISKMRLMMNSLGYNDIERNLSKANHTYRIIVIGDSFVEGLQVPIADHFARRLESMLKKEFPSRNFEVMPWGVGSYSTENEIMVLKEQAVRYHPDLVVLSICFNDFYDNHRRVLITPEENGLRINAPLRQSTIDRLVESTTERSVLVNQLYVIASRNNFLAGLYKRLVYNQNPNGEGEQPEMVFYSTPKQLFLNDNSPVLDASLNETYLELLLFEKIARENNIRSMYFAVPVKEQVSGNMLQQFNSTFNSSDAAIFNNTKYQQLLSSFFSRHNMDYLELYDEFRRLNTNNSFYNKIDGHWNSAGNELVAELLFGKIKAYVAAAN